MSNIEVKTRIITLTDRAPVKISDEDWPIIASRRDDSWTHGGSGGEYEQALSQGQLDRYSLFVRQHADGRTLVYGIFDAACAWTGSEDWRGGELLDANADIAAAIRRVGTSGHIPDRVIRDCIADLPPQSI